MALLLSLATLCMLMRIESRISKLERNAADTQENTDSRGGDFSDSASENQTVSEPAPTPDQRYRPYESDDETFLQRLNELIDANIGNHDLNVDFLAAGMMVSRSLLFNRVRRATGKGIVEYVNGIRIERSTEMFPDENRSLTEIAEMNGFSTLRYYSRVFKSVKGEIPSVWRERMLQQMKK